MNLHLSPRAASPSSGPAALSVEPARPETPGLSSFAGLLGEQMQARTPEGRQPGQSTAFDGPAARTPAARTAAASGPPTARASEPRSRQEPEPRREPAASRQATSPAPTSGAAAEERLRVMRKAAAGGSARPESAAPATDRGARTLTEAVAQPGEEDTALEPTQDTRAQALIDWLARADAGRPVAQEGTSSLPGAAADAALPTAGLSPATPAAETQDVAVEALLTGPASAAKPADAAQALRERSELRSTAARPADTAAGLAVVGDPATATRAAEGAVAAMAASMAPELAAPAAPPAQAPTVLPLAAPPGGHQAPVPAAAPQLLLATPVTAPDFSQALAAQLTTLARDGIQQATLQLHPAEMGPIEVRIVLDGAQAQVDFAAAHAQTRQAIESGLPSLAAALQGAGLTLAGGGVFEQRPGTPDGREPTHGGRSGTEAGSAPGDAGDAAAPSPRRQAVRGLLDVYA